MKGTMVSIKVSKPCDTLYNVAFSVRGSFTHGENIFLNISLPSTKKYQVH